jgi:predicted aldo/keto reductase-like oxidoreductase
MEEALPMRYRKLGKTGVDVSILGFGAMRLPMVGNPGGMAGFDPSIPIEEIEANKMVHHALEQGVNYFDTAYLYHGGQSEKYVGKVLKPHRSKVMIATKLPVWNIQKKEDFEKIFSEQLEKLQTDYLDVYLVHGLDASTWAKMKDLDVLKFMDELRSSGRIRFAGFSFHDNTKTFKEIVDAYNWDLCQIQYNFYDRDVQAGKEGLDYAASREIGVVIMEPLRGGKLVDKIPQEVQSLWDSAAVKRSPVEWAMRWLYDQKEISTVLTGASTLAQLTDHTRMIKDAAPDSLTPEELVLFDRVRTVYKKMLKVDCTGCGYCMPCPNGVEIPRNFQLYNDYFLFKDGEFNAHFYNKFFTPVQRASGCFECRICLEKCPQKIDIIKELKEVHQLLGEKE